MKCIDIILKKKHSPKKSVDNRSKKQEWYIGFVLPVRGHRKQDEGTMDSDGGVDAFCTKRDSGEPRTRPAILEQRDGSPSS